MKNNLSPNDHGFLFIITVALLCLILMVGCILEGAYEAALVLFVLAVLLVLLAPIGFPEEAPEPLACHAYRGFIVDAPASATDEELELAFQQQYGSCELV